MSRKLSNTYSAIHQWIRRNWGKASRCEHCGTTKGRRLEWATKGDRLTRKRKDWLQLCRSCHKKYDDERHNNEPWNKGKRLKPVVFKKCEYCNGKFEPNRKEQVYCGRTCANTVNGNQPKNAYLFD